MRIPRVFLVVVLLGLASCGEANLSGMGGPTEDHRLPFGQTYAYADGVSVTATPPEPFLHSEEAIGGKSGNDVRTTVTITNNSTKPVDLSGVDIRLLTGLANAEAAQILDTANLLENFSGSVPPGKSASTMYGFAYSTAEGGPAALEVILGPGREPIAFDGSVI